MIHSKSKSSKIKSEGIHDENPSFNNKINIANVNNSTSESANYMSSTKENLNLESLLDNNNNIDKISNLFNNDENDDKIINISKLDEDLYSNDQKSARFNKYRKHLTNGSNSQLIEVNKNGNDNENNSKIINISQLDIHINNQDENKSNIGNINSNENNINNQIHKENIKIEKKEVDEPFKVKKKSFFDKISFRMKMIILIISVLLVFFIFAYIILKITIK